MKEAKSSSEDDIFAYFKLKQRGKDIKREGWSSAGSRDTRAMQSWCHAGKHGISQKQGRFTPDKTKIMQ